MKIVIEKGTDIEKQIEALVQTTSDLDQQVEIEVSPEVFLDNDFFYESVKIILKLSIIGNKLTYILADLYRKLNLYDNKRLLKNLKEKEKGAQFVGDNRYDTPAGIPLSEAIYEDIIDIAAYELTYNDNQIAKEILIECLDKHTKNFNSAGLSLVYTVSCMIVYRNNCEDDLEDINMFQIAHQYWQYQQAIKYNSVSNTLFAAGLIKYSKKKDLYKDNDYIEMSERIMKKICLYLKVRDRKALYNLIRGSLSYSHTKSPNPKAEIFTEISDIFAEGLITNKLGNDLISSTAPELSRQYMDSVYTKVLNSTVFDIMAKQSETSFSAVDIEDIKAFLVKMMFVIYEDVLINAINDLLKSYYKNFNFDKVDRIETIKALNKDLYESNQKLETLQKKLIKQEERSDSMEERLKSEQKETERVYIEHIKRLERENDALEEANSELQTKLKLQEDYIKLLEMPETEIAEQEIDYVKLAGSKIVLIGGRSETNNELKKHMPAAIFTSNETDNVNMANVDYIVMFTKFMSHALYYKYINIARELGIKVIYCANNNTDMILSIIAKEIE